MKRVLIEVVFPIDVADDGVHCGPCRRKDCTQQSRIEVCPVFGEVLKGDASGALRVEPCMRAAANYAARVAAAEGKRETGNAKCETDADETRKPTKTDEVGAARKKRSRAGVRLHEELRSSGKGTKRDR